MGTQIFRRWAGAGAALGLAAALAGCGQAGVRPSAPPPAPPLIDRADLFGDPVREGAQLSPRGDRVAFLAPRDGVVNLWVLAVDALDQARPVTDERERPIRTFAWARDNATLLYLQDDRGDENWRLYAVDAAAGGAPRALTPAGARAEIVGLSAADPNGVIVTLNQRDRDWPDVYRIDLVSGERALIERNTRNFVSFLTDRENNLRLARRVLPDGGAELMLREGEGRWRSFLSIAFQDAPSSQAIAIEADGRSLLMFDSTDRDRAALMRVDLATGAKTVLGESARADVVDVWIDPTANAPEAYGAEYLRREWRALDADAQADLDFLDQQLTGDFRIVSRSLDDARWIVVEEGPASPPRTYLYDRGDRTQRRLTLLFRNRPALEQQALQPMRPIEVEARDGLTLVSYLTLPTGSDSDGDGRPDAPAPLVVAPHGGPWARDSYGFSALHQWLANRGYAVLSVNFRGSSGFGRAFLNAGNGEWGGRIEADIEDAVRWAVDTGIAEETRVAIVGWGFGGYAAAAALTFAPERYRCAASFGAPLNLAAMLASAPAGARDELYLRVGDPRSAQGRQLLRDRSPLYAAAQARAPLLMAFGARDPFVSRSDADQMAQTLRARRTGLTYLVFPNEGRELARLQNRLSYLAVLEHFLGDCLGGRVEPVGVAFEGADIHVFDGAVNVPGLSAFSRRAPQAVVRVERAAIVEPEPEAAHAAPVAELPAPAP